MISCFTYVPRKVDVNFASYLRGNYLLGFSEEILNPPTL